MEENKFFTENQVFGQIIDEKSRRPYPTQVNSIKDMPAPMNVLSLQSFLVLANYYGNYILNKHMLRASF